MCSKARRSNAVIQRTRKCLKGAPVVLACFWVFQMPLAVHSMQSADIGVSTALAGSEAVCREEARDLEGSHGPVPCLPQSTSLGNAFVKDPHVWIGIHRLQRSAHFMRLELLDGDDVGSLLHQVQQELQDDVNPLRIMLVHPQPFDNQVTCIAVPACRDWAKGVPVLFRVCFDTSREFVAFLFSNAVLDDIIQALGDIWCPGLSVFLRRETQPVNPHQAIQVDAGDLITVVCAGTVIVPRPSTQQLLKVIHEHHLHGDTSPDERLDALPHVGFVGALADCEVLPDTAAWSITAVRQHFAGKRSVAISDVSLSTACQVPCDLWFRGARVTSLVGVSLDQPLHRCAVFVDARSLACSVQLLLLDPEPIKITDLLLIVGAGVFEKHQLRVKGAPFYSRASGSFIPAQSAVIIIDLVDGTGTSARDGSPQSFGREGCADSLEGESLDITDEVEMSHCCTDDDTVAAVPGKVSGMWNRTSSGEHASPACRFGDTPAVDVPETAAFTQTLKKSQFEIHLSRSSEVIGDVPCYEIADAPPDIWSGHQGWLEGGESESACSEDTPATTSTEDALPVEWRVLVKVLRYQQHTCFHDMWVQLGEDAASFLARAEVLLNSEGGFYRVVLPDPQPEDHCICVMLVPGWWAENGTHSFIVAGSDPLDILHMNVAEPDTTFAEVLPPARRDDLARIDLYTSEPNHQGVIPDPDNWIQPCHATVLYIRPEGAPPPRLRTVQQILSDPARAVRLGNVPQAIEAPTYSYLLMGAGSAQVTADVHEGPLAPQLADVLRIAPSDMMLWVQRELFEDVSVRGRPIHRCIGFRARRDVVVPRPQVVFIDPRSLGMPISCRILPSQRMMVADFLNLLGAFVPEGHYARFDGGEPDPMDSQVRVFGHCSSVVLWVERAVAGVDAVATDVLADEDREDDGSRQDDCDGSSQGGFSDNAASKGSTGGLDRSRSPRRDVRTHCYVVTEAQCVGKLQGRADGQLRPRCIPTPCRSHRPPVVPCGTWKCELEGGLKTLLDLATKNFEAVLPVEGLERHCKWVVADCNIEGSSNRSLLSLSEHLPPRTFDLTLPHAYIGRTLDDVCQLVTAMRVDLHDQLPDGIRLHSATAKELMSIPCKLCAPATDRPDVFEVYCDGSFDGMTSAWAFVVIGRTGEHITSLGWAADRVVIDPDSVQWLGAQSHGALQAEGSGVCLATMWALHALSGEQVSFNVDSMCAIMRARGSWSLGLGDTLAKTSRCLVQAAEAMGKISFDSMQHIKAHAAHPWNELADVLAKFAVAHTQALRHQADVREWIRDGTLEHLWLLIAMLRSPRHWPHHSFGSVVDTGTVHYGHVDCVEDLFGGRVDETMDWSRKGSWRPFRIVSFNVQTLENARDRERLDFPGRVAFVRRQMEDLGVDIVALQETRSSKAQSVVSDSYIRLCSGSDAKWQLGVELWFARGCGKCSATFRSEDLTVVHWDSRCLCVKVAGAGLRTLVANIHAPTAQSEDRDSWWQRLRETLARVCAGQEVLLLGDFNIRLAASLTGRIGEYVWDTKHPSPVAFKHIIVAHDVWVPSTFKDIHEGPHETWVPPNGGQGARIDYVMPPATWCVAPGGSVVLPQIDVGQSRIDHWAVRLDVWVHVRGARPAANRRPQWNRKAMSTEAGQATLRKICASIPMEDWSLDADSHYLKVQTFVREALSKEFPAVKPGRAHSYFSDATWVIKDHRVWLRRQTADLRFKKRSFEAFAAWTAWRHGRGLREVAVRVAAFLCAQVRQQAKAVEQLRSSKGELRRAIRHDRRLWLQDLARDSNNMNVKDVVTRLRPLLRLNGKRQNFQRALPAVMLEDGTLATTPEEANDRWIRHFSAIEGGARCTPEGMFGARRQRLLCGREAVHLQPGELPSRIALEHACLRNPTAKAMGPDLVPGELLKYGAGEVSLPLYQLTLKMALRLEEPLMWKGGTLVSSWKHKGSLCECRNHRALLVSSAVGKTLHSVVRTQNVPNMARTAAAMQIGGLPRHPVLYAAHASRLFSSRHARGCYLMVFLDLQEAFYRVARPLLTSRTPTEDQYAKLFADLRLPPAAFQSFRQKVEQPSLVAKSGATDWIQAIFEEFLEETWFRMPSQSDVTATTLGSRPGDGLADVMFFLLFAEVLKHVKSDLREVLDDKLYWWPELQDNVTPFETSETAEPLRLNDVTWMDDLCVMSSCRSSQEVLPKLALTAGRLIDRCVEMGMSPNLGANKTEAIVGLRGEKSRSIRQQHLSARDPDMLVDSQLWPGARVRLVTSYKHLGGHLHHTGSMTGEARMRAAHGWTAFQKHRRTVFCHAHVALREKVSLFQTLVMSTMLHGSGIWCDMQEAAIAPLQRAYINMSRAMLSKHFKGDVLHVAEERVLAHLGLPPLGVWFHFHRLTYLTSFVVLGVREMWALAHAEARWLALVRTSLEWLWQHVDAGKYTSSWTEAWAQWRLDIHHKPRRWKNLLKKARHAATRVSVLDEGWQQCRGLLCKCLLGAGAVVSAVCERLEQGPYPCGVCQRVFGTYQAWAVHAFKTHGRVRKSRLLVSTTDCPACLKVYPTHVQLCRHIEHSVACRTLLQQQGFVCELQPGQGSKRAKSPSDFLCVPMQGLGPKNLFLGLDTTTPTELRDTPTWQALQLCFDQAVCSNVCALLERYRQAFTVECLSLASLLEVADAWWQHVQQQEAEDLSILHVALHCRVAEWVASNVSADWLCPDAVEGRCVLATFRQSVECLALMDFTEVQPEGPDDVTLDGGFLLCDSRRLKHYVTDGRVPRRVVGMHEVLEVAGWCHCVEESIRQGVSGLFVFSLHGLHCDLASPKGFLPYKSYVAKRAAATIVQDVVLLAAQLWARSVGFVVSLPYVDPSISSAFKRMPGLHVLCNGCKLLAHNVQEAYVPQALFHETVN